MKALFEKVAVEPSNPKQAYLDAWAVRQMLSFAFKRQKDADRRDQTPKETACVAET